MWCIQCNKKVNYIFIREDGISIPTCDICGNITWEYEGQDKPNYKLNSFALKTKAEIPFHQISGKLRNLEITEIDGETVYLFQFKAVSPMMEDLCWIDKMVGKEKAVLFAYNVMEQRIAYYDNGVVDSELEYPGEDNHAYDRINEFRRQINGI